MRTSPVQTCRFMSGIPKTEWTVIQYFPREIWLFSLITGFKKGSLWQEKQLEFYGTALKYRNYYEMKQLLDVFYGKEWVPYCKKSLTVHSLSFNILGNILTGLQSVNNLRGWIYPQIFNACATTTFCTDTSLWSAFQPLERHKTHIMQKSSRMQKISFCRAGYASFRDVETPFWYLYWYLYL